MTNTSTFSFRQRPATRLGRWAGGLAMAFLLLFLVNSLVFMPLGSDPANEAWTHRYLPFFGILIVLCGLASGITGLAALVRNRERSWLVWLAVLPGAFMAFLLLGEFLFPH